MKTVMLLTVVAIFASCSTINTPNSGMIYMDTTSHTSTSDKKLGSKMGLACTEGILGVVIGDSSLTAAVENGKLNKVTHVEHTAKSVLGIYTKYCTVAYGK